MGTSNKKEKRYLVKISNDLFNSFKNDIERFDWYFPNHRIRLILDKNKKPIKYIRINNSEYGATTKKEISLGKFPDKKELNKLDNKAEFKLHIFSKLASLPKNKTGYLEKIKVYKNNKLISTFYSTESENKTHEENISMLLKKYPEIKIHDLGYKNMRSIIQEIATKKLINKKFIIEEAKKILKKPEKSRVVPCTGIKQKLGFSCKEELKYGKPTGKFFITTHRARSKSYDSFDKIPLSAIKFIDSTG